MKHAQKPDARPHVMLVITRAHQGGAQTHVRDLFPFRSRAHITVVAGEDGDLQAEARARGLDTHVIPSLQVPLNPRQDLQAFYDLWRLMRRVQPDLVHLHSSKAGLLGRLAARLAGIRTVFTAHGWAFTDGVSPRRKALALLSERLVAPFTDRVITVSNFDRELALRLRLLPAARVRAVHNGIPDDPLAPHHSNSMEGHGAALRAVMVARFSSQKDQDLLVRAVQQVPGVQLSLVGEGERLDEVRQLVQELNLTDRVHFLGNRTDVPELLAQHDVFCLCSNYEGFPISTLEAMRAGLPTLLSDVGGSAEAVLEGQTGRVLPRGDLNAWVKALQEMNNNPEHRQAMGEAARAHYRKHFTSGKMLSEIWSIYEELLPRT